MAAESDLLFASTRKFYYICFSQLVLLLLLLHSDPTTAVSSSTKVGYLPGFDGPLPFELETGYVNVDGSDDVHLFYYFVKSEKNPSEDPLILWFPGGPSCSGLYSFFFENGPLTIKKAKYDGSLPTLVVRPYSWTKVANILFLDTPVDTGFSYSNTLQGSYSSDTMAAKQLHIFLKKWLTDHPEFLSNPIYIGGSSYSGIVVPIVVQEISKGIVIGEDPLINLKGYLLGNPVTDRTLERNSVIQFAFGMGIIPIELFESAKRNCDGEYVNVDHTNVQCTKDLKDISECTSRLDECHILEPYCLSDVPPRHETKRERSLLETLNSTLLSFPPFPEYECRSYNYMLSYYWANNERVQQALTIRKGTIHEWLRCKYDRINYLSNVKNSIGYHVGLSNKYYRSLIYSGDHDITVPSLSTQEWIKSLNQSIRDDWRPWLVNGQIGGYTRIYVNDMTFATIKGGGHVASEYKPKESLVMLEKWLSNESL